MNGPIRAVLTLGNRRYDAHTAELRVSLSLLPGVGSCEATIPPAVTIDAAPGEGAGLDLDAGDGAIAVLRGTIAEVRRGARATGVLLADAGVRLARLRPTATFQRQGAKEVVRALASDAGVAIDDIDLDLPLAAYAAHAARTASEHVARLAELGGAVAAIDGEGRLRIRALESAGADAALRHGREVVDLAVSAAPSPAFRRIVTGAGPAGSADAPDAMRPTTEALPAGAPAPGAGVVWSPAAVLRTPSAASSASRAADRRAAAATNRLRARCVLLPRLRPGLILDVQSIPGDPAGRPWLLTRVAHRIGARGGETLVEGISVAPASLAADLGGALAAAAGGLF